MKTDRPTNEEIAEVLDRVADLLEAQEANPFRVRAYRRAARVVAGYDRSISEVAVSKEGDKLEDLPNIGESIAGSIREFVHTRRLGLLDRREGQVSPEDLFTTLPGIGDELARRIHEELHVDTLEELELAAHDGRLGKVPGMGRRRIRALQDSLGALLSQSGRRRARRIRHLQERREETGKPEAPAAPALETLLAVDAEYREKAEAGRLRTIAPRRFNPERKAWLPVYHTEREGWHFTARYSNTARAHSLGRTRDWVVIYQERDGLEDQCTVVTEHQGPLAGRRVVRGRERECREHYQMRGEEK